MKSGWALAVLLAGPASSPAVVDVRRVDLSDPSVPESIQPFHQALERPNAGGAKAVTRLVALIREHSRMSVAAVLQEYADGRQLAGAGVVVGSQVDPSTIKNDHIRAHAEEGRLFREVLVDAAARAGVKSLVVSEKQLHARAAASLHRSEASVKKALVALGRHVTGGWRAEHKGAALAAWIALVDF